MVNLNQTLAAANLRNLSRDWLESAYNTARTRLESARNENASVRAGMLVLRIESEIRRRDWVTYQSQVGSSYFLVGPASEFVPVHSADLAGRLSA